jgi:hypothetical protein
MSLWTPGGEHPVDPAGGGAGGAGAGSGGLGTPGLTAEQEAEAQAIAQEMAQVREQLAQVPAAQVVANHAMGCWELAAIHLSAQPPRFAEAQVAIDAFAALVDVLEGRLGPDEATLKDALAQLRLAFVQLRASVEGPAPAEPQGAEGSPTPTEPEQPADDAQA